MARRAEMRRITSRESYNCQFVAPAGLVTILRTLTFRVIPTCEIGQKLDCRCIPGKVIIFQVPSEKKRLRSAFSFTLSALLHGSVLAWVALGPLVPEARLASAYDQLIRPLESKLIWYDLDRKSTRLNSSHRL